MIRAIRAVACKKIYSSRFLLSNDLNSIPCLSLPMCRRFSDIPRKDTPEVAVIEDNTESQKRNRSWLYFYLITMIGSIFGISYLWSQRVQEYKLHKSKYKVFKIWVKNKLRLNRGESKDNFEVTSEDIKNYIEEDSRKRKSKAHIEQVTAESINSQFGREIVHKLTGPNKIGYANLKKESAKRDSDSNLPNELFFIVTVELLGVSYPKSINEMKEVLRYLKISKVDWMFTDEESDIQIILQKTTPYKRNAQLVLINPKNLNKMVD
jgi:hypothetical protein